ncbi:MAG TPA: PAS domain-containing protein [Burkholderiales bacterium]
MNASESRIPVIALCATLGIIIGISAGSYISLQRLLEKAQWADQSHELLRETQIVLADLKDVEIGVRDYLISGNKRVLAPYLEALADLPIHLDELRRLSLGNPEQQEIFRDLEKLTDQRLDQAARFLRAAPPAKNMQSGPPQEYLAAGTRALDEIRTLAGDMLARQRQLLARNAEDSRRRSNRATGIIVVGMLASIAVLFVAFVYLRREISRRANTELAAQAAAQIESLYNEAPCGYHSVDRNGVFVRVNDTELSWLGYSREEMVGKMKFVDVVAPEFRQTVIDNFPRLVAGQATVDLEYVLVRKNGSTFPVMVNAVPQFDAQGDYLMSRTTMFDTSAMKAVEMQFRQTNAFLDAVVENIPSMIFVKEAQTLRFARINTAEERLLGMPRETVIGKSDHELFPREQADFFVAKDREVLAQEGMMEIAQEELSTAHGTLTLRTRKIALRDSNGRPQYLLGISDDITEQRRAEEAIRALNARLEIRANQLEAANKELESFSYSVSHDLRAPLRAIDGFSKIFAEDYGTQLDDEGRRLLKVIRDNSQRMGALIDDLLAFSRLGRQALSNELVDMRALAAEAVDHVRVTGPGANASVLIHDLPEARGDPILIKQIWINLLSNALKYSSTRPSPVVEVGALVAQGARGYATYFVKDNGVGFDMRYYDKLFGVFQRLHQIEDFPGTGVGLAIVHRLVTRHGGRVWAEAEQDKGATFYFSMQGGNQHG